jgi:hypothetical protein
MIAALINLIIILLVVGILYWLLIWVIQSVPIPDPPARLIRIALTVLMVIIVVLLLLNLIGIDIGPLHGRVQ